MKHYEWLIREVLVFDGSGLLPHRTNVAWSGERISAVGSDEATAVHEFDGRDWALCPGFVDVHSHDDFAALVQPELPFKAFQGVTTEVLGNCGIGAAPSRGARAWMERFHPGQSFPDYDGYDEYFARLEAAGPSLNLAKYSS
jgi:N-acyl-D-aspartate/D-glutamate deacylase